MSGVELQTARVERAAGYAATAPADAPARDAALSENSTPCKSFRVRAAVGAVVVTNCLLVASLFTLGNSYPALISPGLLALGFGLRHGVDCDHIAAIDNVARKLAYAGKPAALVGLWFSLGHSSIVVLLCAIVAGGSALVREKVDAVASTGAVVSAVFSSVTLLAVGAFNLATVGPQFRAWRRAVRTGESHAAHEHAHEGVIHTHSHAAAVVDDGDAAPARVEMTGFLTRCGCCQRLLASIDAAWKMFFVGVLFGIGFETASEVGLLALAAVGPKGVPSVAVMILPLLFTSGMALVDTCDGLLVLLTFAQGDGEESGRLLFGLLLTAVSAVASLAIGGVVALGLVAPALPEAYAGPLASLADALDAHTTLVGLAVVAMFVSALLCAVLAPALRNFAAETRCCGAKPRGRYTSIV